MSNNINTLINSQLTKSSKERGLKDYDILRRTKLLIPIAMRKLLFFLSWLFAAVTVSAQSTTVEEKISNLETQISTIQQAIGNLQSQIEEVTKQNISLKQALHLQPTISEYNTEGNLNIHLISATGNRQKGEITFTLSVLNPTRKDILYRATTPYFIDENGHKIKAENKGCSIADEELIENSLFILPDTPLEMIMKFLPNEEPQYAKTLVIPVSFGGNDSRFINIPIKWE